MHFKSECVSQFRHLIDFLHKIFLQKIQYNSLSFEQSENVIEDELRIF